jgi:PAS domain S-box-containing protein
MMRSNLHANSADITEWNAALWAESCQISYWQCFHTQNEIMNILHITANTQEAEFVRSSLTSVASDFHLHATASVKEAAAQLSENSAYEAILLDMNLPGDDANSILTYVRQKGLPLAIIAIINAGDEDPPTEVLKAGADDYVVKRGNYVNLLLGILRRTMEHRRIQKRPARLLYAGNMERARHELAAEKWIQLDAAIVNTDGSLEDQKGSISDFRQYGAIILEESYLGAHILRVLRDVIMRVYEVPVLLLIEPGHEEIGVQGLNLGAADYIVKSGVHLLSLTTKLRAILAHRELVRRMPSLESSEAHLRMIVEVVPVSLLMLARDGGVLAINMSGVSLIGAARAEDIVAKNLLNLLPSTQADLLKSYIEQVCKGERRSVQLEWGGLDGKPRLLELSGVQIQGGPNSDVGVLSVLTDITQANKMQLVLAEAQARLEQLQQEVLLAEAPAKELAQRMQIEGEQWEITRRELEERAKRAEEQKAQTEEMLRAAGLRQSELAEKYAGEKAQREAAHQELEQKARDTADQRAKLEEALQQLNSSKTELAENFSSEKTQWEAARAELEQKARDAGDQRARLEEALQQLNSSKTELAENFASEKTQWEAARAELEQKERDAEDQRAKLEEALQQLNSSKVELVEKYSTEKAQWEVSCQALEQKAKSAEEQHNKLEQMLQLANSSQSVLAKKYASEKTQWEAARQELEQKLKDTEDQRIKFEESLQQSISSKMELAENYSSEKTQWEAARQELEQKVRDTEDQREKLKEMLQITNSSQSELAEKYEYERAQWESIHRELEQKIWSAEEQQAQLAEMLQHSKKSQSELAEMQANEKTQWEAARQELELRVEDAEHKRSRIEEVLHASNSRQSELVELHARERAQWGSIRQELEKDLSNMAGLRAELAQALQLSETQKAELAEKYAQVQAQKDSAEGKLEQQIKLSQLLEAQESQLVKQHEELRSSMENSYHELEQKLEELQLKSSSLEIELRKAQEQQEELIEERRLEQDKWNRERVALEQQSKTLADAVQELETANAKLAGSVRNDQQLETDKDVLGSIEKANAWDAPTESKQSDLSRVHRLIDDTENRYQLFVRHQSDSYQKLLSEAMQRAQRDTEEWKRILSAQNVGEREFLELMLRKAESRIQRLEEQFKKEREELEFKLQAEEERRRRLSDFCSLGLSVSTVEGRILDCNDTFARIFGYQSSDEIMKQPEDEPFKALAAQESLDGRLQAQGETPRVERCARRKDGQPVWLLENVTLIPREGEEAPVVERGVIDVTERQQLFAEIRRARRIEAIVELSAAAVREFNVLLDSMMEISNIALLALDEHDPRRGRAAQIHEMANRASSLARELSAVIQKQGPKPEVLEITETLREMVSMLRLLTGDDVELQVNSGGEIGAAAIERSRFEQAITSLIVAARDSLPAGGTVSVETIQGVADQKTAPFPYVMIAVTASGYGALAPQISSSLSDLITSCKGHLQTRAKPGKEAVYELFIPLA